MMNRVKAVVLAAGMGTRLRTTDNDAPKVLREANGKPLLQYVLEGLGSLPAEDTVLVLGYQWERVHARFPEYPYVIQEPQLGTGHAVRCAEKELSGFDGTVLVCCGDMPLLRRESYESLLEVHTREGNTCTFLTGVSDLDLHCGRILRDSNGIFQRVVEDRDCTPEQQKINEYNAAVYAFDCQVLLECLKTLKNNNAQGEYYLTDVPEEIIRRGGKIGLCALEDGAQIVGVNTPQQLQMVEQYLRERE